MNEEDGCWKGNYLEWCCWCNVFLFFFNVYGMDMKWLFYISFMYIWFFRKTTTLSLSLSDCLFIYLFLFLFCCWWWRSRNEFQCNCAVTTLPVSVSTWRETCETVSTSKTFSTGDRPLNRAKLLKVLNRSSTKTQRLLTGLENNSITASLTVVFFFLSFLGDKILSVTICFRHVVYEDALTILSYASPYDVTLELEKNPPGRSNTLLKQRKTAGSSVSLMQSSSSSSSAQIGGGISASTSIGGVAQLGGNGETPVNERLVHPLYRSQSIDDLSKVSPSVRPSVPSAHPSI